MLKFRTMVNDAPRDGQWMDARQEAHLTRIGGFLRRTRLNEIPQLLNILTGNMSLIGPRPETQAHVETLTQAIPLYNLRHMVKPGLSGWAAVNAGYAGSIEAHEEVLQYDLFYAERKSIHLNLLILVKTISTVLFRPGK